MASGMQVGRDSIELALKALYAVGASSKESVLGLAK